MFVRDSQEFKIGLRENVELDPNQNIIVNPDQREIVFSSFEFSEQGVNIIFKKLIACDLSKILCIY